MDWIEPIKDAWWLLGVLLLILGALWRLAIKTNQTKVRLDEVKLHDTEIKAIKGDTATMKQEISGMREALDKHILDQREDMKAINGALFSILDILQELRDAPDVKEAHQNLRKRQLER